MLKIKNALKTSLGLRIVRFYSDIYHNHIFYRNISINGSENIEPNKPTIIGPNHQNAIMDAVAIFSNNPKFFPAVLARSDIFSKDIVGNLFTNMKLLPVYRIRDGKEKLALNEEIFDLTVKIIENNGALVLFPEAQHTKYRSLLPLKKGLMRIAFHTAEKNNFDIDLQIIPAGITYKSYFYYRTDLIVNYGKPFYIKDYQEIYKENKQAALLKLRKDMREAMIPLTIHIKNKDFYDQYEQARDIFDYKVAKTNKLDLKKQPEKFKVDKKTIATLDCFYDNKPEEFADFAEKIKTYSEKLSQNNLKDYLFDEKISLLNTVAITVLSVILLPLNLLGFINYSIPLGLPELLIKKFKDKQFHSSIRYVAGMYLAPLWGIIGFILLWIFTKIWWIGLIFLFLQRPFSAVWFEIRKLFKKALGRWRFIFLSSNKKEKLQKQRNEILSIFDKIDE